MKLYTVHFRQAFNASLLVEAETEEEALAKVYSNGEADVSIDFSYGEPVEGSAEVTDENEA